MVGWEETLKTIELWDDGVDETLKVMEPWDSWVERDLKIIELYIVAPCCEQQPMLGCLRFACSWCSRQPSPRAVCVRWFPCFAPNAIQGSAMACPHPTSARVCSALSRAHPQLLLSSSLPGTAGRPATTSSLLILGDKSRNLMQPGDERSGALSREQQTRQVDPGAPDCQPCDLPACVSGTAAEEPRSGAPGCFIRVGPAPRRQQ